MKRTKFNKKDKAIPLCACGCEEIVKWNDYLEIII